LLYASTISPFKKKNGGKAIGCGRVPKDIAHNWAVVM
jgi:hypothetical protein